MKLALTDAKSGKEVVVEENAILLLEADPDPANPNGSHIVLGSPEMGRQVQESPASIAAVMGVVAVPASKAAMVADVAKGKRSR